MIFKWKSFILLSAVALEEQVEGLGKEKQMEGRKQREKEGGKFG